jgi:hypothetical protein
MRTENIAVGSGHFAEETKKRFGTMATGRKMSNQNGICALNPLGLVTK